MKTNANTPPRALAEYQRALSRSVREALDFDPSGRPGAAQVREDQRRLTAKRHELRARIRKNMKPLDLPFGASFGEPVVRSMTRAQAYKSRHSVRQARVDLFISRLEAQKRDDEAGSPGYLFTLPGCVDHPEMAWLEQLGGGWWLRRETIEDRDWEKYSKSWHRTHGPAVTVTARRVTIARMVAGVPERHVVNLATWSGDWRARAIVEAGLAPTSSVPLAIRLHRAYDAELVSTRHGYRIYRRTLLGQAMDWVAVAPLGTTYHHETREGLIRGLHDKLRNRELKITGRLIDWAKCRSLGFCETGIRAFCDAFGLSPRGAYAPEEIERAVRSNPGAATPYLAELKTLATALGFAIPEFN